MLGGGDDQGGKGVAARFVCVRAWRLGGFLLCVHTRARARARERECVRECVCVRERDVECG